MSRSGKSAQPIRQLSLQPPAPRRPFVRRQRSATEDKSLQICVNPLARGKRGTSAKPVAERPKVRLAWRDNRCKDEKEPEQVEVVARQIPGRTRPIAAKSRCFAGIDRPSIFYSRQELAERLRLAWKHRLENKTNIDIFLAHKTVEDRCDSQLSSQATVTAPSSPEPENAESRLEISLFDDRTPVQGESTRSSMICARSPDNCAQMKTRDELSSCIGSRQVATLHGNNTSESAENTEKRRTDVEKEQMDVQSLRNANIDEYLAGSKRRTVPFEPLSSIKIESTSLEVEQVSKGDLSSAKQKRANFHSGTNRAFLDPIRSPTIEFRSTSGSDGSTSSRTNAETKQHLTNEETTRNVSDAKRATVNDKIIPEKTIADGGSSAAIDRNSRTRTIASKDAMADDKCNSTIKITIAGATTENQNNCATDRVASTRNSRGVGCSSVNERSPPTKKATELQKVDLKLRRTSSAPPSRHTDSNSANNRGQVNIAIGAPSTVTSGKCRDQGTTQMTPKTNATEKTETRKVSTGRSVRSAPLKRRSRSAKRRFWGSATNDEEGKPRNRSSGHAKSSIDSKTVDIVTMVSLVSSADSDSDVENSPRDDQLINELRSKLPITSIIKTSTNPTSSARKPIKSVSFQKDSLVLDTSNEQQPMRQQEERSARSRETIVHHRGNDDALSSNDETVSRRTEVSELALPVLGLNPDADETLDPPLTDREKRCLAVPIGDLQDKKRKLLKTRSSNSLRSGLEKQMTLSKTKMQESSRTAPQKVEAPVQQIQTSFNNSSTNVKSIFISSRRETVRPIQPIFTEPRFQTNKEKECWHLYRKMCDKGVCVSFDTVLRGMLTPTEYRLRQKELSEEL